MFSLDKNKWIFVAKIDVLKIFTLHNGNYSKRYKFPLKSLGEVPLGP